MHSSVATVYFFRQNCYFYTAMQVQAKYVDDVAAYLEQEKHALVKHEYVYGKLLPMPGNTKQHELIKKRLSRWLDDALSHAGLITYTSDIKVMANDGNVFFYPDIVLAPLDDAADDPYMVATPLLVVEVLSNSTRVYDTVDKYIQYSKIPSLQHYWLVEADIMHITCMQKNEAGSWQSLVYNRPNDIIRLQPWGVQLTLGDVYSLPAPDTKKATK